MRAKEYLEQLRTIRDNLARRREQLEELREEAYSAQAIRYDSDRVQNTGKNTTEEKIFRFLDKSQEVEDVIAKYLARKDQLIGQIEGLADLPDPNSHNYATLLYKRYVECKKLEEISLEMGYSYIHIRRMHREALKVFWRMYLKEPRTEKMVQDDT